MHIANWKKVIALGILCGFYPANGGATTYTAFDTGDNSEIITDCPGDNLAHVIYSQDIGSLSKGDTLMVDYEAELTNPHSFNVLLGNGVLFGNSATSVSGPELTEGNGFNLTPTEYHGVVSGHAIVQLTSTTATYHFVNVYVRCVKVIGGSDGDLTVEPDHGRLQILVIHN